MRLREGVERLRQRGYKVELGRTLREATRSGFFSGSDARRAEDLVAAFADDRVDAVFCARGGYGALRILEKIDYDIVRDHPKPFVGFSDITAIQAAMLARAGLVSFQGEMVAVGPREESEAARAALEHNWEMLFRLIQGGEALTLSNPPGAPQPKTIRPGRAEAPLVGGNLTLFNSLQGTPFEVPTRDAVLYLEDTEGEHAHFEERLDSMILGGHLAARGLVFGELLEPKTFTEPQPSLEEVVVDAVARGAPEAPSFLDLASGHGRYNLPLAIGSPVRIDADEATVSYPEPVVER
jgi:muramoyltetrapeptide carboxypeptidase